MGQRYPVHYTAERTHFMHCTTKKAAGWLPFDYFLVRNSISSFLVAPMFLKLFLIMNSGTGDIWDWKITGLNISFLDQIS